MRATEHNKPAKAWPIGANRTKFIPWPALQVSTFLAVRRATKYWFDAHTMDGGCTCCCTCSISFNNNPRGRKNRWHTFNTSNHTSFLADEAYTITIHMCLFDSQFLSTCQQTPRCEPDAILLLELPTVVNSLMGSLRCFEQTLRVTQVAPIIQTRHQHPRP